MPILIKDFSWEQTGDQVIIKVKYYEKISRNADIFIHKNYVKVNNPPFYFEKFLRHPINDEKSRCRLMDYAIYFYLKKSEEIEWDQLEIEIEKQETREQKEKILQEHDEIQTQRAKERAIKKQQLKRNEVLKEVERENIVREKIENFSKSAFVSEIETLEQIKTKTPPQPVVVRAPAKQIQKKSAQPPPPPPIPSVRQSGNIVINFSKRNFVTPVRESRREEELEWLTKQHLAKKTIGFAEEDLRDEERNPEWLKEKGDEFLQKGNYLGAVAAYSAAIKITQSFSELYINRSAAHYALKNYQRSVEDCSKAYELLTPHCDANLKARIECLIRRGRSLFELGYPKQGYNEMAMASKLEPLNVELKRELEDLEQKFEVE